MRSQALIESSLPDARTGPRPLQIAPQPRLLLVEDDPVVSGMLASLLADAGYAVEIAPDGQYGLHRGLSSSYDLLIIDRGLPALEGTELVRTLRRRGVSTPVLMLTAWGAVADRIAGLDAGAEDYLIKPFDTNELLARLRALHRRHREVAESLPLGTRTLVVAERRMVKPGADDVVLTPRECALLCVLARSPTRVFSRGELLDWVFGDADTSGLVDTYVHYLRRKLGRNVVRTIRGRGYRAGTV